MTKKMIATLIKLYNNPNGEGLVHQSTAWALERRGLAITGNIPKGSYITQGGNFPHVTAKITQKGMDYCQTIKEVVRPGSA